jgi:Uma2 family endonuclease
MSAIEVPLRSITAEEFESIEREGRYDLIHGRVVEREPMAGEEHGSLAFEFGLEVGIYVRQHNLGRCYAAETRFVIARDPDTAIAPDWAFISKERMSLTPRKGFGQVVPDALLEVRSPGDTRREAEEKMQRWIAAGVRLGWELDPSRQVVTIYRPGAAPEELTANDVLSGEEVLPGFSLPLRRLFASLTEE